MLRYILAVTVILITLAAPASAQTIKQGAALGAFLETHTISLGQTSANFTSMQAGLKDNEKISAATIYDATTGIQHYFDTLFVIVSIYSQMVETRDQATVKKYVVLLSNQAVKASELVLPNINRELARLNSPAAISEAQKIRDLIIKIRDEIQRVVPAK